MSTLISGDLLKLGLGPNDYIVHQCNCKTTRGLGLSKDIFDKYPHANIYGDGSKRVPGEITVRHPVINLLGQFYPGKPKWSNDTKEMREAWFRDALTKISKIDGIEKVYFPYGIGCGLAGGSWKIYLRMIEEWTKDQKFETFIVRL